MVEERLKVSAAFLVIMASVLASLFLNALHPEYGFVYLAVYIIIVGALLAGLIIVFKREIEKKRPEEFHEATGGKPLVKLVKHPRQPVESKPAAQKTIRQSKTQSVPQAKARAQAKNAIKSLESIKHPHHKAPDDYYQLDE